MPGLADEVGSDGHRLPPYNDLWGTRHYRREPCVQRIPSDRQMVRTVLSVHDRSEPPSGPILGEPAQTGSPRPRSLPRRAHHLASAYLLCRSRSRNVIPLLLRLRFTGQLRQLFRFLVRPSSWRLSRGETWPSRCSPGRKQSPSWPASTRSAGSSSTNRCTPRNRRSTVPSPLFCDPRRSSSSCRLPSLGCGNWSWA